MLFFGIAMVLCTATGCVFLSLRQQNIMWSLFCNGIQSRSPQGPERGSGQNRAPRYRRPFRYGGEAFWAQIFQIDGPTQPNKRTTIFAVPFDVQLVARPMRLSLRLLRVEKFSKLQFFVRQGASFTPFWKSSPVLGDNLLGIGVNLTLKRDCGSKGIKGVSSP